MTKSEFLAQENVPEFIKAIVASLPGDADVEIESFKLGKPQKKAVAVIVYMKTA